MKSMSFPKAFGRCFVYALFSSYAIMIIFWAVNGFRFGIEQCGKVLLISLAGTFTLFFTVLCIIMVIKYITLVRLRNRRLYTGSDKKYFSMLKKYLGGLHSDNSRLCYAYRCAESGKCKRCLSTLKKMDFTKLMNRNKAEYLNTLLYCAVLSGRKKLAEETYIRGSQLLYTGAKYKGNEHFCLTLGLYSMSHGDYFWGESLLKNACASKYKDVKCNALLALSQYYLEQGKYNQSKSCIIGAGKCLRSLEQCKKMRKQMITIQNIFGVRKRKTDKRKENCYDN